MCYWLCPYTQASSQGRSSYVFMYLQRTGGGREPFGGMQAQQVSWSKETRKTQTQYALLAVSGLLSPLNRKFAFSMVLHFYKKMWGDKLQE